ncbi:helix-turn-helix domain-containing protein [Streptomyces sp. I05A-00742]|uniref:winged helix-turn-helix transcriptional regulator n=1 Tax=Streptomyces sp. I05A-00742 TaxID=2732853 RepID=UPI0014880E8C|nr:helix-turn-helix domain-containing protein [Streptomyces sp. I05A-00742]
MKRASLAGLDCSIARTLDVIGEWWTPLVLREIFLGRRRFEEIQRDLGIARNVLTARLTRLVESGILERRGYGPSGARSEYRLTERGRDLYPVLLTLQNWGDRWLPAEGGPPTRVVHTACGHDAAPRLVCGHCGDGLPADELLPLPGPGREEDPDHPLVRARTGT